MDTKKLHEELYRKKSNIGKRELSEDRFDPEDKHPSGSFMRVEGLDYEDIIDSKQENFFRRNKLLGTILISIAGFVFILIVAYFVFSYLQNSYAEERVLLKVESSEFVDSGEKMEYKIIISNNNRAELHEVVLNLSYSNELEPKEFNAWEDNGLNRKKINVGTIASNETIEYNVPFSVFGSKDTRTYLDVSMNYKPENISSFFDKKAQGSVLIKASLLQIELFSTKEVANGELMKIDVIINNKSDELFKEVELNMEYPEQFEYQEATALPVKDNTRWIIENIEPSGQRTISIFGTISGPVDLSVPFYAKIGHYDYDKNKFVKYSDVQDVSKIISDRITITQSANRLSEGEAVSPGQSIQFKIFFKNTSQGLMKDMVLRAKIFGKVFSEKNLNAIGGYYDKENQELVWKASSLPALKVLAPNEEGSAVYNVTLNDYLPVESESDKNFVLETQASIESLSVDSAIAVNKRIYSNKFDLKIKTKHFFNLTGSYNDPDLPNSGPFPLEMNQETTVTSKISLQNTTNDLEDVVFSASFPVGISWKNDYLPENANIQFNENSNEFVWNIGKLKAGTGFIFPTEMLAFRIGIVPSENQAKNGRFHDLILLNNIKITAKDSFTGDVIDETLREFKVFNLTDY